MNWKAVKISVLLCLLFILVYGGINSFTAVLDDIGAIYLSWEQLIPFVPGMIVPYMSIDLFFIAAPFICRDDRARRTLAKRIAAAILVAGVCFLLFPMRFSFDRPHVEGPLGLIFNNFRLLDKPFNQFPSLHIALQMILLPVYAQRTRGVMRAALFVWFSLIACSTVLTYQHHVIDVFGGVVLGAMCIQLLPEEDATRRIHSPNKRVGLCYACGSAALLAIGASTRPWGMMLLWPAASLGIVAAAYCTSIGASVYRKRNGRLPISTRLLLGPVLIGQRLSLAHYAKQSSRWDVITDRIWIGRKLSDREARVAIERGVSAVVDLTAEFSAAKPFLKVNYLQLPVMDLTAPTTPELDRAVEFIRHANRDVVFVHCKAGYSRAATVVGAYLLACNEVATVGDAIALLRAARPQIVIRPEAARTLEHYANYLNMRAMRSVRSEQEHSPLDYAGVPSPR